MTVGVVQQRAGSDLDQNLARAIRGIEDAARRGAEVICLQELFRSPYFCQSEDYARFELAEPIPGPTTAALAEAARRLEVVVVASLFERRAAGLYHNTAAVIDADGALLGIYRKMHIPDDPGFYEKFYFTPGDLGFRVFQTRYAKVGVLVCWDQWYPEAARLAALGGAEVLFYPTAIGWLSTTMPGGSTGDDENRAQHDAWEVSMRAHSVANGIYVAAANRTGVEGDIRFWGQSFVTDAFGGIAARASVEEEETLVVSCDLARIDEVRRHWPFLRDRRVDAYGPITRRYLDEETAR